MNKHLRDDDHAVVLGGARRRRNVATPPPPPPQSKETAVEEETEKLVVDDDVEEERVVSSRLWDVRIPHGRKQHVLLNGRVSYYHRPMMLGVLGRKRIRRLSLEVRRPRRRDEHDDEHDEGAGELMRSLLSAAAADDEDDEGDFPVASISVDHLLERDDRVVLVVSRPVVEKTTSTTNGPAVVVDHDDDSNDDDSNDDDSNDDDDDGAPDLEKGPGRDDDDDDAVSSLGAFGVDEPPDDRVWTEQTRYDLRRVKLSSCAKNVTEIVTDRSLSDDVPPDRRRRDRRRGGRAAGGDRDGTVGVARNSSSTSDDARDEDVGGRGHRGRRVRYPIVFRTESEAHSFFRLVMNFKQQLKARRKQRRRERKRSARSGGVVDVDDDDGATAAVAPPVLVEICSARNLALRRDGDGDDATIDPYCSVRTGDRVRHTTDHLTTAADDGFVWTARTGSILLLEEERTTRNADDVVTFEVFDCDVSGDDRPLGSVSVSRAELARGTGARREHSLEGGDGDGDGDGVLALRYRAADEDDVFFVRTVLEGRRRGDDVDARRRRLAERLEETIGGPRGARLAWGHVPPDLPPPPTVVDPRAAATPVKSNASTAPRRDALDEYEDDEYDDDDDDEYAATATTTTTDRRDPPRRLVGNHRANSFATLLQSASLKHLTGCSSSTLANHNHNTGGSFPTGGYVLPALGPATLGCKAKAVVAPPMMPCRLNNNGDEDSADARLGTTSKKRRKREAKRTTRRRSSLPPDARRDPPSPLRNRENDNRGRPELRLVSPGPDPTRPKSTTYMTDAEINVVCEHPSTRWVHTGLPSLPDNGLGQIHLEILKCDGLPKRPPTSTSDRSVKSKDRRPSLDETTTLNDTMHSHATASVLTRFSSQSLRSSFSERSTGVDEKEESPDPFVAVVYEDAFACTDVVRGTASPRWTSWTRRAFSMCRSSATTPLFLAVYDRGGGEDGGPRPLGRVALRLDRYAASGRRVTLQLALRDGDSDRRSRGVLAVRLRVAGASRRRCRSDARRRLFGGDGTRPVATVRADRPEDRAVVAYATAGTTTGTATTTTDARPRAAEELAEHADALRTFVAETWSDLREWRDPVASAVALACVAACAENLRLLPSLVLAAAARRLWRGGGGAPPVPPDEVARRAVVAARAVRAIRDACEGEIPDVSRASAASCVVAAVVAAWIPWTVAARWTLRTVAWVGLAPWATLARSRATDDDALVARENAARRRDLEETLFGTLATEVPGARWERHRDEPLATREETDDDDDDDRYPEERAGDVRLLGQRFEMNIVPRWRPWCTTKDDTRTTSADEEKRGLVDGARGGGKSYGATLN